MKERRTIFESILREAGFKVTKQRLTLLETLSRVDRPLTASEIQERVGGEMDQVTVYRALEAMSKKNIVRKVDTQHAYTHYELVATKKHHHHAICMVCGVMEDVSVCLPPSLEKEVEKSLKNFNTLTGHSLEFIGRCKKCS